MQLAGRRRRALALAAFLSAGGLQAADLPQPLRDQVQACAKCHGEHGNLTTANVPSLAGQPPTFFELQMILFREGLRASREMQPIAGGMSDAEISALAAYYAAQKPRPPAGRPDKALYAKGRALAQKHHCGSCHLPDYRGRAQMPRLAGQREDYLAAAMTAYRDNQRSGSDTSMNGVMYGISNADIRALAHYLARHGAAVR